jgi:hypothetical protein
MLWVLNSGTYAYTIILPTISTQWKIAGAADFLGNGQAGIALQNIATGQRNIWVLNNGGLRLHDRSALRSYSVADRGTLKSSERNLSRYSRSSV